MMKEFVIDSSKVQFVKEQVERIRLLFSTNVTFQRTSDNCEKQWILKLDNGNEEEREKAKEYVYPACAEVISEYALPAEVYNELSKDKQYFELERQSRAVIKFCCDGEQRKIIIRGTDMALAVASLNVEEKIDEEKTAEKIRTNSKLKTKEEESEVLKISMKSLADTCKENRPRKLDPSLKDFAMKLDYTEEQIESVVKKFGPEVTQDKLLHELICTSAGKKISRSMDEEATQLQADCYSSPSIIVRGAPCSPRIKSDPIKMEPLPIITHGDDLYEPPHLEKGIEDDSDPDFNCC